MSPSHLRERPRARATNAEPARLGVEVQDERQDQHDAREQHEPQPDDARSRAGPRCAGRAATVTIAAASSPAATGYDHELIA